MNAHSLKKDCEKVVTADLLPQRPTLAQVSHIADQAFISKLLEDYREKKSEQTLRRQRADLSLFATYLDAAGLAVFS